MNTRVSSHSRRGRRERRLLTLGGLASGLMLALSGLQGVMPVAAQTVTAPIPQVEDRGLQPDADRLLIHDRRLDDVFANGLDDRQVDVLGQMLHLTSSSVRLLGMDDVLQQARGLGFDDQALADILLTGDVPQEDRQADRQIEVGDDRLTVQPEQQIETGDVRQEDRGQAPGDVRQEDRGQAPGDVRQEDRSQTPDDNRDQTPDDGRGPSTIDSSRGPSPSAEHESTSSDSRRSSSASGTAVKPYYGSSSTTVPSSSVNDRSATSSSTSAPAKSGGGSSSGGGHGGGHDDGGGHH